MSDRLKKEAINNMKMVAIQFIMDVKCTLYKIYLFFVCVFKYQYPALNINWFIYNFRLWFQAKSNPGLIQPELGTVSPKWPYWCNIVWTDTTLTCIKGLRLSIRTVVIKLTWPVHNGEGDPFLSDQWRCYEIISNLIK